MDKKKAMNRRDFFKVAGAAGLAATALAGCRGGKETPPEEPPWAR